ncbi:MAG: hypothetical protein AMS27_06765 [Bacteroides sp. SM23_62_1]|nr:MAG: hypothetical protein AMS27_06765 [Bacteroides sp. SM23_62_1]
MKIYLRIVATFGLIASLLTSCDEPEDEPITFDSQYYLIDFTVDPVDRTGYHIFSEKITRSNLDSLLETQNLTREELLEVHVKETMIHITDTDASITFDPLEKLSVTIYTEILGEKTIASIDPIPRGVRELSLFLEEDDLKDYLYEDEFMLSAVGILKVRTYKVVPMQAKVKFQFKAGVKK